MYCAHRMRIAGRAWLYVLLSTVAALPIWVLLFPGALHTFEGFAKGGCTFPVVPAAHILLYLVSLFWLIPIALRSCLSRRPGPNVPLLLAWVALVIGTIPAALGRCDPGHVLYNGLGAFILTLAVLTRHRPRFLPSYAVSFFLIFGLVAQMSWMICFAPYLAPVRSALAGKLLRPDSAPSSLVDALGLKDFPSVAAPLDVDRATKRFLIETGRYVPEYLDCFTEADAERRIKNLSKTSTVVVPDWVPGLRYASEKEMLEFRQKVSKREDEQVTTWLGLLLCYPIDFKGKHLRYDPLLPELVHIASHYRPVRNANGWVLMAPEPRWRRSRTRPCRNLHVTRRFTYCHSSIRY